MSAEIHYFTGTGNTLSVARDIAEKTGARLRSIPSAIEDERIAIGADAVGVAFPVYHQSIPLILKRFFEKLEPLEGRYVFGVCTYGDSPGLAIEHLGELVQSRGGQLAAGFAVHMPYNYVTPSFALQGFFRSFTLREIPVEKQRALLAGAQERAESIAATIRARETGTFETCSDPLSRLAHALDLQESLKKWAWLRIAGVDEPTGLSFLESRQLMDRAFYADTKCNGCGISSRVCPVRDIRMVEDRPVWQHRCEQCFACLQWCPQRAIQFGSNTTGRNRYHHPEVKLADMLAAAPQRTQGDRASMNQTRIIF